VRGGLFLFKGVNVIEVSSHFAHILKHGYNRENEVGNAILSAVDYIAAGDTDIPPGLPQLMVALYRLEMSLFELLEPDGSFSDDETAAMDALEPHEAAVVTAWQALHEPTE